DESSLNVCGNEEIEIFKTLENYPRVHTFKSSWLRHWIGPAIHSSEIARNLKRNISNEDEDGLLIQALWESRGNLSTASNQLFIHRNTLNYRIDRFKEKTGLNLRDYDDLLMVYLMNI
ncbi:MAG: helix-turn-helix domain-containing protein, partial [Longicatena sp.]